MTKFKSRRTRPTLLAPFAGIMTIAFSSTSAALVMSQVYGGGGNTGATYTHDFIELFNDSASPVNLSGLSVQRASVTCRAVSLRLFGLPQSSSACDWCDWRDTSAAQIVYCHKCRKGRNDSGTATLLRVPVNVG